MKYRIDCIPEHFINPDSLLVLPFHVRRQVYSAIFTLAILLKRANANLKTAKKIKNNNNEISKVIQAINVVNKNNKNNSQSIYYQVRVICKSVLKLFELCSEKLNVNIPKYFVKYSIKKKDIFYEIATPIYDSLFCKQFNNNLKKHTRNHERQEYQMITRLATGLSWSKNTKINNNVCVKCILYIN